MNISSRREGALKIISVTGFLDAAQASRFHEEFMIESSEEDSVLLDCTALEYLDSSGLATLVNVYKALAARNAKLVIYGFPQSILRVLRFTKLDRVFTLANDLIEARSKAAV